MRNFHYSSLIRPLVKSAYQIIIFLTYVVGTQKNRLNETVLLSTQNIFLRGRVALSVGCLATDACLTADPGVASLTGSGSILSWRLIMK